jgi:DNA modification methylase
MGGGGGAKHPWYGDRKQTTVWTFDRPSRNPDHPTSKPIDLIAYPISLSSQEGDLVIDFFGGSGSTLIACEKTHRICYSMEIDPRYCDVIIARWEAETGRKATKVS